MKHDEFVQKYRSSLLVVRVNKEKAGFLYQKAGLIPHSLRNRQANLRAIAFGGAGLGVVLFFLVEWWIAALVLVAGILMFPYCQQSAAKGVLETSLLDPDVYRVAFETGVLQIDEKKS